MMTEKAENVRVGWMRNLSTLYRLHALTDRSDSTDVLRTAVSIYFFQISLLFVYLFFFGMCYLFINCYIGFSLGLLFVDPVIGS